MAQVNFPLGTRPIETINDAYFWDATVNRGIKSGVPMPNIIALLAREKQLLMERIVELESLCPSELVVEGGQIMVWHCPDELIPLQKA